VRIVMKDEVVWLLMIINIGSLDQNKIKGQDVE
jgi:hypothetical protein